MANEGIAYKEEAYATMLDAPLDDSHLRGDEPSVLFLRLQASNPDSRPATAQVWFLVSPQEQLYLKDGLLFGTGDKEGAYPTPRLRAGIAVVQGDIVVRELNPGRGQPLATLGPSPLENEDSQLRAAARQWSGRFPCRLRALPS